jgi:hypothetical protein
MTGELWFESRYGIQILPGSTTFFTGFGAQRASCPVGIRALAVSINWLGYEADNLPVSGDRELLYNPKSNPHPFYSFRGLKKPDVDYNCVQIRFAVESWILEN